jgi:hypothetical protein
MSTRWIVGAGGIAIAIGIAACGGIVARDGEQNPTPSSTNAPPSTSPPSPGPSPTSTSSSSPPPPPPLSCVETTDRLTLTAEGAGHKDACPSGAVMAGEYDVQGRIVATKTNILTLDTCGPAADCPPILFTVTASAPGLDLGLLPIDSYVQAHLAFYRATTCTTSIVITSLDTWEGEKNPVDAGGHVYLVASEGAVSFAGLPFQIVPQAQHCKPFLSSCSPTLAADDYVLRFRTDAASSVDVAMGETKYPFVTSSGDQMLVRNLRSFYDGRCDDGYDWAFWAVRSEAGGI